MEYIATVYRKGDKEHYQFSAENDAAAIAVFFKQGKKLVATLGRIEADNSVTEIAHK